jgi:acetyl esterase/lipase
VWGSSAGGHLSALVGSSGGVKEFDVGANAETSSRVQAVCDFFGPTDLMVFAATPGYESHAKADSPEAKLIGGAVPENKDKAARVNPIAYVTKDDPPFLIVHGDKDPTVPLNQSQLLFDALKKTGVSARFHTIRGAGHGGPAFEGKEVAAMVAGFFDERLKGGSKNVEAEATESQAVMAQGEMRRRGVPWEAVTRRNDKNGDGKVAKDEFSGPAALFQRLDRNGDGFVTRDEHEAAVPAGRP